MEGPDEWVAGGIIRHPLEHCTIPVADSTRRSLGERPIQRRRQEFCDRRRDRGRNHEWQNHRVLGSHFHHDDKRRERTARSTAPRPEPLPSRGVAQQAGQQFATSMAIKGETMGRGILLWLLGVPIPIIILLALIWR
jgi:hypothetical protein